MKKITKKIISLMLACVMFLGTAVTARAQIYSMTVDANERTSQTITVKEGDKVNFYLDVEPGYTKNIRWSNGVTNDRSAGYTFNSAGKYTVTVTWQGAVMGTIGVDSSGRPIFAITGYETRSDDVIVTVTANSGGSGGSSGGGTTDDIEHYTATFYPNGGKFYYGEEYRTIGSSYANGKYFYYIIDYEPTRTGYTFVGWCRNRSGIGDIYRESDPSRRVYYCQPGEGNVSFYAIWDQYIPDEYDSIKLKLGEVSGYPGEVVEIPITVTGGYDFYDMELSLSSSGAYFESINVVENIPSSGYFGTAYFRIPTGKAPGTYSVYGSIDSVTVGGKTYYDPGSVTSGKITVLNRISGDVNNDGAVDVFDILRLKKYLAEMDVDIHEKQSDVDASGEVDVLDLILLRKYLAGMNVTLQ